MAFSKQSDLAMVLGSFDNKSAFFAALPHAVEGKAADRHVFQERFLTAAKEDLQSRRSTKEGELASTVAEHSEANERANTTVRKHAADAVSVEEIAIADAKAKGEVLVAARKDAKAADANYNQLEKANREIVKVRTKKQHECERVKFIKESAFNMLCSGGWEDGEAHNEAIKTTTELLKSLDAEPALIASLAATFSLKPEQRKEFDKVVESESAKTITNHLAKLEQDLADTARSASSTSAETLGLWAILEEANDAVKAAEHEKSSADEKLSKASDDRTQAERSAVGIEKLVCDLATKIETLKMEIEQLTNACDELERLRVGDYDAAGKQGDQLAQAEMDAGA